MRLLSHSPLAVLSLLLVAGLASVSAQSLSTVIQAEDGSYGNGTIVERNYAGYNGTGFLNLPKSGGYVQLTNVDGAAGGTSTLIVRYALASGTRAGALIVNGKSQAITFNSTGAWSKWQLATVTISLAGGRTNTLRLESNGQDFPNVDEIRLTVPTATAAAPAPTPTNVVQAENASYGGGTTIDRNNAGYHGTGFANLPVSGGYLQFNAIDGGAGGSGTLAIRYALGTGKRSGVLSINGKSQSVTFAATGAWTTWQVLNVPVSLKSGAANTLRFQSNGQDLANIDEISVALDSTSTGTNPDSSNDDVAVSEPETLPTENVIPAPVTSGQSIFTSTGAIDPVKYAAAVLLWDKASASERLGPTFAQLNPNATDTRPTLYKPTAKTSSTTFSARIRQYELGTPGSWSNYWSTSGQVAYVPDAPASDPGLDRVQIFAFYNQAFALSPRLDPMSALSHPDLQTQDSNYVLLNGEAPKQPVAMVRNYGLLSNEALVLYRDGLLAVAGTQTSRAGTDRPYPGFMFPENKVPTGIALTALNEFALVTVWDTKALKGQLAVIALEGKFLAYHTWPYMGFPNQGSWSSFKLLGYIDLPMAAPTSVSAASNGWWESPGTTGGLALSQIDLSDDSRRKLLWDGNWQGVIATKGYAIVASKQENKVCFVDLTPLFTYMKQSYLSSVSTFRATIAARGAGDADFPKTFSVLPSIKPTVVYTTTVAKPTTVLAGVKLNRWTQDRHKAYVASEDGTISIFDTSSLKKRWDYEKLGTLRLMGTFKVARNPVSMAFMRFNESGVPLVPTNSDGTVALDPLNGMFYVACRGDREIDGVVSFGATGSVYRRIMDRRMGDPVAVSVTDRANIVTVADFDGKKILSFRVGTLKDASTGKVYGCGASGTDKFELAGELSFNGNPFLVNSCNVN